MRDFKELVLCAWHNDRVEVHVSADLEDDSLTISGYDLGSYVEDVWGDFDYEYWYFFNKVNTDRLFAAIHGKDDPEAALLREFSGEAGCRTLRELCQKNAIEYSFQSYA